MVNADKWFLVVTRATADKSGLDETQTRRLLLSKLTETTKQTVWKAQRATHEFDGERLWLVTYTDKLTHDEKKKMAYVVDVAKLPRRHRG